MWPNHLITVWGRLDHRGWLFANCGNLRIYNYHNWHSPEYKFFIIQQIEPASDGTPVYFIHKVVNKTI